MATLFSTRDLELLGYSDIADITDLSASAGPWKVFSAKAIAGVGAVTHRFCYLHSTCTKDHAESLARQLRITDDLYLLAPKSGLARQTLQGIFPKATQIVVYEDLIWEKLISLFSPYVESLRENIVTEKYYVTPRSEESRTRHDRLDEILLAYLRGDTDVGCIKVVSASAAVGKTTLARYVIKRLADQALTNHIIPTYVEASHWGKLQLESVDDLWDIISNSLSTFSRGLAITEGLFMHALKQGYLAFVFDGFDELCGQRHSQFNAREVLQWLIEIARKTDARIVITTRTLFWEAEVGEIPECTSFVRLRPFETPQAKDYLHKYFPADKQSADRALQLYKQLIKQSQRPREGGGGRVQFANLPLCVGMIARYVKEGGAALSLKGERTIIEQFLLQILERERGRQQLTTSAKDQLSAFEDVAVSEVDDVNSDFDLELLAAAGFAERDIAKLNVHHLLTTGEKGRYRFSYAFLASYLQASYLAKIISRIDVSNISVWPIMVREANGKGYVIEHLVELLRPESLEHLGHYYIKVPTQRPQAKSFLLHVAKIMVEETPGLITAKERLNTLFLVLGGDTFKAKGVMDGLYVVGTLDRLDFSGISMRRGIFYNTTFSKCMADSNTIFDRCRFFGDLAFQDCDKAGWSQVELVECDPEPPTNLIWEGMLSRMVTNKEEHIIDALGIALSRFWHHGRFKATIRRHDWNKGTLGHSVYCKPIIDEMLRVKLVSEEHISGVHEGGYVFAREAIPDLQRFMDNRELAGKIKVVYDALRRS